MASPGGGGGASGSKGGDLLDLAGFDEPPPPTDFSKQIETLPLPEQITLDLSKCEKGPIGPGGYGWAYHQLQDRLSPSEFLPNILVTNLHFNIACDNFTQLQISENCFWMSWCVEAPGEA